MHTEKTTPKRRSNIRVVRLLLGNEHIRLVEEAADGVVVFGVLKGTNVFAMPGKELATEAYGSAFGRAYNIF